MKGTMQIQHNTRYIYKKNKGPSYNTKDLELWNRL